MPPLPRLRIAALEDLAHQLRFASPEAALRHLERTEALAGEIDGGANYPADWVHERITGHRVREPAPATLVGAALLSDLTALAERLSAAAGLRAADLPAGSFLSADDVAARLGVSRKTLERYRRRGLPARRATGPDGRPRLYFARAAVERFERDQRRLIARAAAFTRIEPALRARMIRRAEVYHRRLGCSLNHAAQRLARRYGRAHETVRQLLRRHDAGSPAPIFANRGPPSPDERATIVRAARRAEEPRGTARGLARSTASVRRVLNSDRAARLRALDLSRWVDVDPGSEGVLLAPPARADLGAPGPTDLLALVEAARHGAVPIGALERSRATAHRCLMARAARAIAALPQRAGSARTLDAHETDLRWAARQKAELVRSQLPLLLRTVESTAGCQAEAVRPAVLATLAEECLARLADAVDAYDPARGGRLAAPAGLALMRAVSGHLRPAAATGRDSRDRGAHEPARASPRLRPGVSIPDFTRRLGPWQAFLEPDPAVRAGMAGLDEPSRTLLVDRFGWSGPPQTLDQLAAALGVTRMRIAQMERRAIRASIACASLASSPLPVPRADP